MNVCRGPVAPFAVKKILAVMSSDDFKESESDWFSTTGAIFKESMNIFRQVVVGVGRRLTTA
jgi:hypothetical protein